MKVAKGFILTLLLPYDVLSLRLQLPSAAPRHPLTATGTNEPSKEKIASNSEVRLSRMPSMGIPRRSAISFLGSVLGSSSLAALTTAKEATAAPLLQEEGIVTSVPSGPPLPIMPGSARFNPTILSSQSSSLPSLMTPSTPLGTSRILAQELVPLTNNALNPFASKDKDIYYPSFFQGTWECQATLIQKIYPYGPSFLPSSSLYEGSPRNRNEQVGDSTKYLVRYVPLVPVEGVADTTKQQLISDRGYNAIEMSKAYQQLTPVQSVEWNPDPKRGGDPSRLTLAFAAGSVSEDMRPLGQRKGEVYITARQSEFGKSDGKPNEKEWCASERIRSVLLVPGNVVVSDTETITEYHLVEEGHVQATSRIAVYLTPNPNSREGVQWQAVNGKAVAFFDYVLDMKKV